jgi:hypothetical protein
VFQGYGRPWGYRPNYGIAGYGAAIGAGIAGALLGFLGLRVTASGRSVAAWALYDFDAKGWWIERSNVPGRLPRRGRSGNLEKKLRGIALDLLDAP